MLNIVFWILWLLCLIGALFQGYAVVAPAQPAAGQRAWLPQLNVVINLILLGILGFKVLKVAL